MAQSAMELQLGVFCFLPTTHVKTKANKMLSTIFALHGISWMFIFMLRPQQMQVTYAPNESHLFLSL